MAAFSMDTRPKNDQNDDENKILKWNFHDDVTGMCDRLQVTVAIVLMM